MVLSMSMYMRREKCWRVRSVISGLVVEVTASHGVCCSWSHWGLYAHCNVQCRGIRLHALFHHGLSSCVGEGVIEGPVLISCSELVLARGDSESRKKGRRKGGRGDETHERVGV